RKADTHTHSLQDAARCVIIDSCHDVSTSIHIRVVPVVEPRHAGIRSRSRPRRNGQARLPAAPQAFGSTRYRTALQYRWARVPGARTQYQILIVYWYDVGLPWVDARTLFAGRASPVARVACKAPARPGPLPRGAGPAGRAHTR